LSERLTILWRSRSFIGKIDRNNPVEIIPCCDTALKNALIVNTVQPQKPDHFISEFRGCRNAAFKRGYSSKNILWFFV
jgi:hypothetical protein